MVVHRVYYQLRNYLPSKRNTLQDLIIGKKFTSDAYNLKATDRVTYDADCSRVLTDYAYYSTGDNSIEGNGDNSLADKTYDYHQHK
jgi:hypothetical protein